MKKVIATVLLTTALLSVTIFATGMATSKTQHVMWLDHFALLPGCSDVTVSFNAVSSGVGGGLTALVIQSSTTGDTCTGGGNKVVHMAAGVTPHEANPYNVVGVRVCYELTSSASYIDQIRIAQVQDPPSTALVLLDDATPLTAVGPVCVNSAAPSSVINPEAGSLLLSLRVNFGSTSDKIAVRALGLLLAG